MFVLSLCSRDLTTHPLVLARHNRTKFLTFSNIERHNYRKQEQEILAKIADTTVMEEGADFSQVLAHLLQVRER